MGRTEFERDPVAERTDGGALTASGRSAAGGSAVGALLSSGPGVWHLAGADAVSRYELGVLVARRDGRDVARLRPGLRAESGLPGALDVRLTGVTVLRGAREFLVR
jgi:acyl CoA:acetate/3-ketoacid CoA transferase